MSETDCLDSYPCSYCGAETRCMGFLHISFPSRYVGRLSKKVLRSKDLTIWGFDWNKSDFICTECSGVNPKSSTLCKISSEKATYIRRRIASLKEQLELYTQQLKDLENE